jgi:hypothetical protein
LGEKTGDGRKKGLSRMKRSVVVVLFVDNGGLVWKEGY